MRARPMVLVCALAAACGGGDLLDASGTDGGGRDAPPGLDSAVPLDGADPPDFGVDVDGGPPDTGDRDGAIISTDIGPPATGESCSTAVLWPSPETELVAGTTTTSRHREQLTCAGSGPRALAPETWWRFDVAERSHVLLRLGTLAWDGVLAVRTGTCTRSLEMCSDTPPIVELPDFQGPLFVGVDGYTAGRGPYAIEAELGARLTVPPANASCAAAQSVTLPFAGEGHNFGGDTFEPAGCAMESAVFYTFDVAGGPVSARAVPRAGQDLELGLFDGCTGATLACASTLGRGIAEVVGPTNLSAGRYIVAVGARADRPVEGSFRLSIGAAADCRRDAECPMGERCSAELRCAAGGMFTATSTITRPIPDGAGALEVPLALAGPTRRPRHVDVRVAVAHPYPEDLAIELVGPTGVRVRLRNRSAGATDVTYGAARPPDGPGALDDLGIEPTAAGTWTLRVEDRAAGDRGDLLGWSLDVE